METSKKGPSLGSEYHVTVDHGGPGGDFGVMVVRATGGRDLSLELIVEGGGRDDGLEMFARPMSSVLAMARAWRDGGDSRESWGKDALRDWMLETQRAHGVCLKETAAGGPYAPLEIWDPERADDDRVGGWRCFGEVGEPADDETFRLGAEWLAGELGVDLPWAPRQPESPGEEAQNVDS